jgi:PAS domain S-box-containing protein/hemerythrin-like metal-binding protein
MLSAKTELLGNAVSTGGMATRVIAIALAYFITGQLGLELAIVGSNITLIWLPTGIAVAALFRWGWGYWPAVWLGALSVNLAIGSPFPVALGISVGNTLGPMLGVALLRRWHFDPRISTWSDVPVFVVGGALLGMLVSATGGVATLVLGGLLPWPVVSTAWIAWWLGDSVGVIVAGMAFITFDRQEFAQLLRSTARKDLVVSASVIAVLGLAWVVIPLHSLGYAFLASLGLSTLVWIALRLGPSPAAIAVLALSACAAWALATGRGPVLDQSIHLAIAKLWACITTISIVSMLMAALTSERKQAEDALKESEAFNLAIMDSMAAEIVAIDCDGVILSANKRWNDFAVENSIDVGKPVARAHVGANYLSVCQSVTGADSEAALNARNGIRAVLDGRLPMFSLHYPCHSPTQERWFAMKVTPFGFREQAGAVITHVDITEHKRAEEGLRLSEERYRFSLEVTGQIGWSCMPDGQVEDASMWRKYTGQSLQEVAGWKWLNAIHPEDRESANKAVSIAVAQKCNYSTEYRLRRADGVYRNFMVRGILLFNADGSCKEWVGTCIDITDHKQAEDALRESEALFRAVSESAHDAIVTADSSGNIIKWNPSAGELFGYSEREAIGQSLTCLMPKRFRDRHVAGMSRVSAGGDPHVMGNPVELVGLRSDGSEFPLELSLARWQIDNCHFFTGVIRDITERKKIEHALENQREHLEEEVETRTTELSQALEVAKLADQTKDAFLANMSHELRTPLSAVIGMANLARGISTDPKLRDYLEKIVRSGQHLNRIINELLDLSKIAAGHMELENIPFSLRTVIAHVESVMSHRAAEKSLAIVTVIGDAVPDVLLGDPTRVAQIFLNLIGNAIKFTDAGQITVRVGLQAKEGGRVCLDIDFEDTGIGMRPEDLKQLFKPFSQADASVSRKFGGTGLGLTISRRLAEMMDGDISVTSIEGGGTTFKVRICLGLGNAADLLSPALAADEVLPKRYQDARILVADDQPLNREIVEALLLAVGITPCLAENGQEVLDILAESGPEAFDLVLMDIQMPVMDGHAATRAVRRRSGFEKLPIIAMTAHTMAHEKEINTAAGMNDHIGKPFDNASFYRTLAKWIPASKQVAVPVLAATEAVVAAASAAAAPATQTGSAHDHLRGVNLANGLARFNGKEERYRHWLADFVENAGELPDLLRSDLAAAQPESAAKAAHAFRGRVGMLGMDDLHGVVSALEHALRDGTPTEALLGSLEQSIGEVRNELTQFFARDDVPGRPAVLEKMVWDEAYSVGVAAMDDQHKKLFGMINQLADCHAARNCESSGVFHEVLSNMFDYTQLHFKDEEVYLQRIGYPKLARHEGEHATFVEKVTGFSIAAEAGVQDEAAVHRYLKVWLQSHILESDMQYRDFVKSKR